MNKITFIALLLTSLIIVSCDSKRMVASPFPDNNVQKKDVFNPSKKALNFYYNKLFDSVFERYDLNKDLKITLSEYASFYNSSSDFNKIDKNQDKILIKDEASFNKELFVGFTIDESKSYYIKMSQRIFDESDKNKDGFLTRNECLDFYGTDKYIEKLFKDFDKDKNNKINFSENLEYNFYYYELFVKFDENDDSLININEFYKGVLDKNKSSIFTKFDKNKDNKLNDTEFNEYYNYIKINS
ncbi:MAG: hypothetical protein U0354_15055 [Candidatus Sericytochromatia bacterium]